MKDLPSCLEKMKKLRVLVLKKNEFDRIPQCVKKLSNLQELDLSYNLIPLVSKSDLKNLAFLRLLNLTGNTGKFPPSLNELRKQQIDKGDQDDFAVSLTATSADEEEDHSDLDPADAALVAPAPGFHIEAGSLHKVKLVWSHSDENLKLHMSDTSRDYEKYCLRGVRAFAEWLG